MQQELQPTVVPGSGVPRGRGLSWAATWIAVVSLVLGVLLIVPYLAPRSAWAIPPFLVVFGAAVTALVLASRARRQGRSAVSAFVLALVAIIVDVALMVFFLSMLLRLASNHVEFQASGPGAISGTIEADDVEAETYSWVEEGSAIMSTQGSRASITVTSTGDATAVVSCKIRWNREDVVSQRGTGSVTCSYDAG